MKRRVFLIAKFLLLILVFLGVFSALAGMGVYLHYSRNLPKIITISDYKPRIVTEVFDRNGIKIGEFYREKREIVPYSEIPIVVIQAFISSEDDKFFEHKGLDFSGIARAMIANFKTGRFTQGGSTITQQVARSLLLTSEKKISRKIKEAILAGRIEGNLTKEDILFLYLNQIYMGHHAYGIRSAARLYFNKDVSEIDLSEAALLAGLPQAPSRWSPFVDPDRAKKRQLYVLSRMVEEGYISKDAAEIAANKRLKLYKHSDYNLKHAPYFTELVRKYLVSRYGDDTVLDDGLKIYTTLDLSLQHAAQEAIKSGLTDLDKRQGFVSSIRHLETDEEIEEMLKEIHREIFEASREFIYFPEPWHEFKIRNRMFTVKVEDEDKNKEKEVRKMDINVQHTPIEGDKTYKAVVLSVNDKAEEIEIGIGNLKGIIPRGGYKWARPRNLSSVEYQYKKLKRPSKILKKGDVIYVSMINEGVFSLEQEPEVEAALLSFDIDNGFITAMVGGYDFTRSEFNRAYQAKRQAGSSFKPLIYAAAIDKGYTPATIIVDSPIIYGEDDEEEEKWKPTNYSEKFYGDTTFREALVRSRNIPTTKILHDIQIPYAMKYTRKLGIKSKMQADLSFALGSTAVSLWEMSKAFSVFASDGRRVIPFFIEKIEDRDGNILEEYDVGNAVDVVLTHGFEKDNDFEDREEDKESEVAGELIISPQTAYIMNYLLKEVAYRGTGAKVGRALKIPVAGKTGTSNDFIDAWFVGYTPDIVTTVWIGFDDNSKTLGRGETGAKAAIPVWLRYMKEAVKTEGSRDFKQPEGIKIVKIDTKTGKIASEYSKKVKYMPFKEGTEPREIEGKVKIENADETRFFREDY